jgi:hypothetical protein
MDTENCARREINKCSETEEELRRKLLKSHPSKTCSLHCSIESEEIYQQMINLLTRVRCIKSSRIKHFPFHFLPRGKTAAKVPQKLGQKGAIRSARRFPAFSGIEFERDLTKKFFLSYPTGEKGIFA